MNRLTLLLVVLALLTGWEVRSWYEGSQVAKAEATADHQVTKLNHTTSTHDVAAATHIGAIAAGGQVLDRRNQGTRYVPTLPGANTHAAPATACVPVLLSSPWASPLFRVRYDAGADPHAAASEADAVSGTSPR